MRVSGEEQRCLMERRLHPVRLSDLRRLGARLLLGASHVLHILDFFSANQLFWTARCDS